MLNLNKSEQLDLRDEGPSLWVELMGDGGRNIELVMYM